ncbi:hypothetical protein, partial [Nocardia cyriacigeorgica]|uniref:hypothetical protein n=1 Tax=Nocardia cyriacigeorgica TaxID=135487 RepID=UPI002455B947
LGLGEYLLQIELTTGLHACYLFTPRSAQSVLATLVDSAAGGGRTPGITAANARAGDKPSSRRDIS